MDQKDYKEIAKIINQYCNGYQMPINYPARVDLANDLADYFEKEKKHKIDLIAGDGFNKKQFLKDCGVK